MADLDDALYSEDLPTRDGARHRVAERAEPATIRALVQALDAPHKQTRKRAARLLGDMRPARVADPLVALLGDAAAPTRSRVAAARLLTALRPDGEPALAHGLADADARVRRACATTAAGVAALEVALADADADVAEQAALALETLDHRPAPAALAAARAHTPALLRLRAAADPTAPALAAAAAAGDATALDHLADADALRRLLAGPHRVAAAHALARLGAADPAWITDPDPRVRAAAARALAPPALLADPDAGVAWLAAQAAAGAYAPARVAERLAPHARLGAPSAQPPYGFQADDPLPSVDRAPAALALCQPRFDINLGVAVRSAEAAGLSEVYLIGNGELFRSPARGTDRLVPLHAVADAAALIRRAREQGYQIVAVQQTPDSVPYHTAPYPPRPLFVMGAEDRGVPPALRAAADLIVEIPLFGGIDSLNVAAAATTVIFHWRCHAG